MPADRCGSYPLMNLAVDFGVDYGDVLLWADTWRDSIRDQVIPSIERCERANEAVSRLQRCPRYAELSQAILRHAIDRWRRVLH